MIIFQKLKDKRKYKVYEYDPVMGPIALIVFLLTLWGGIAGLMSWVIWPITLMIILIDLYPLWFNINWAMLSKKNLKKRGNFFNTKDPLILEIET